MEVVAIENGREVCAALNPIKRKIQNAYRMGRFDVSASRFEKSTISTW